MKHFFATAVLLTLAACAAGQPAAPVLQPASSLPAVSFEYSEGACAADADCSWAGEACGGGHGMCTNDAKKYEGALSTCDVNPMFPANRGYACGCVEAERKCGWEK